MLLLQQMIILFVYMAVGYGCAKAEKLDLENSRTISWLVINIANPALLISSAVNGEKGIAPDKLLEAAVLAVAMFAVLITLGWIAPRLLRVSQEEAGTYKLMTIFNNIGYMGFPVIAATYGNEALLYAAVFTLPFNILVYTYGISIVNQKSGRKTHFQWRSILNIGVVSGSIAVILYIGDVPVPQFFKSAVSGFGNLTAPLSMLAIGISLTGIRLKELITDMKLLLFTAVKLLVIPVAGTMLVARILDNELLCHVCMIMLATPVASMVVMLAQQYDSNFELAAKGVALTTVLSVITIPIVSAIVF